MTTGKSPTVLQRSIAFKLERLRKQAGLSQAEAADATGYSDKTISHLETRKRMPQRPLVMALLRAYGAEQELPWFDEQLKLIRRKDWWENLAGAKRPTGFEIYLGLEDGASSLDWWEPIAIPGLLQTEAYARQMLAPNPYGIAPDELESDVRVRMRRQEILTRENTVNLWVITTEFSLRNIDGPDEIKRGQLDHLLELIRLPNVQLQVIPAGVNVADGSRGPFTVLSFDQPDDPGVVYVETQVRGLWFDDHNDITSYRRVMAHLQAGAADPKESAALIEKHRKEVPT